MSSFAVNLVSFVLVDAKDATSSASMKSRFCTFRQLKSCPEIFPWRLSPVLSRKHVMALSGSLGVQQVAECSMVALL